MSTPTQDTEPSEQEQKLYYYGLPTQPKLLARSNASESPWTPRVEDNHPVRKHIGNPARHAIIAKWDEGLLRPIIIAALGAVKWNLVILVRIGYDDEDPKPVIVWVEVEPGSTTWRVAHDAAMALREELVREGLEDVHCEMFQPVPLVEIRP